jgi:hypothetical protein
MSASEEPLEAAGPRFADRGLPPELWGEIELAFRRTVELAAQDRQLDFGVDRRTGRIVVRVRDLDGGLVRSIGCAEALDIIAGAELD